MYLISRASVISTDKKFNMFPCIKNRKAVYSKLSYNKSLRAVTVESIQLIQL